MLKKKKKYGSHKKKRKKTKNKMLHPFHIVKARVDYIIPP